MTRGHSPQAEQPQEDALVGATTPTPKVSRRDLGLLVVIGSLAFVAWPGATLWMILLAGSIALSVGVPLVVADRPALAERLVPIAVIVLALVGAWGAYERASGDGPLRDRAHDGGVIVTRAAAEDVAGLRNPYTRDFTDELPTSWLLVQGSDGAQVDNPVAQHFPYLPAAAIIHVPFVVVADALGVTWDPRLLGWLAMVAAMVAVARRPEPAWLRLGAIAGVGGPFAIVYLGWGTNDLLAVALAVLALCWGERRPALAGVALALALSTKLLLAVLVPPLVLAVVLAGGWSAVRRWWTMPATLVVTCLPFFVASPSAFVNDTVMFNLGRTEPLFPTSGIGLPAAHPEVFSGAVLATVTLIGFALAVAFPIWAVRRWPSVWTAGAAAGVALLCVLVPARTFQVNYLVLVAALLPLAWLASAASPAPALEVGAQRAADPAT